MILSLVTFIAFNHVPPSSPSPVLSSSSPSFSSSPSLSSTTSFGIVPTTPKPQTLSCALSVVFVEACQVEDPTPARARSAETHRARPYIVPRLSRQQTRSSHHQHHHHQHHHDQHGVESHQLQLYHHHRHHHSLIVMSPPSSSQHHQQTIDTIPSLPLSSPPSPSSPTITIRQENRMGSARTRSQEDHCWS